ncbi:MAG: PQQ-binding-like beta-propeller repeat protein [Myxococcaceae bacterium]
MIRFRVGKSWQREDLGPGGPRDEFGLELEGINLLPGANDEPLIRIVTALIDTLCGLVVDGERAGQLSLEDVHLEVCFWRTEGHELELSVIDLASPPRQVRAPVTLELPALVEAAISCARALLRDITDRQLDDATRTDLTTLERKLKQLQGSVIGERASRSSPSWAATREATGQLGFTVRDVEGRTLAWSRKTRAGLPPLLFDGALAFDDAVREGLPFLQLMGLARAATEGQARFEGVDLEPATVFVAGLELCLVLRARNPALAANPYVEALQVRCTDGLTALRAPIPDTSHSRITAPRATPGVPLAPVGELRRVGLQPRWARPAALGEDGGQLFLGKKGPIVHSPHAVHAFTRRGETRFRHLSSRGVAIAPSGLAICSTPERLTCFEGDRALWFRDHDGTRPGTIFEEVGSPPVLVGLFGRRTVTGTSAVTGRELWRFEPQRTQHLTWSRLGPRILVGTDGGTLYGIDAADGQIRFRVKAGLPVVRPSVAAGKRAVVTLNRGEHTAIYLCDALAPGTTTPAGAIVWTREFILSGPGLPVHQRGKTFVSGHRDGRTLVVCLSSRGQVLWEKTVPLDARTTRLLAWEGGVLATDARGAATRLLPDGSPEWVLGGASDELLHPIEPLIRRRTLIVPGPLTRLVQPRGGRVVGELATGPRMLDLDADAKMTIYVLREPGSLETFVPSGALAVVNKSP